MSQSAIRRSRNRVSQILAVAVIISLSLLSGCSDESEKTVVPSSIELSGDLSAHASRPYTLTIAALDANGNPLPSAHARVSLSVSAGTVNQTTLWLDGAATVVQCTLTGQPGMIELHAIVEDGPDDRLRTYLDPGANANNVLAVIVEDLLWTDLETDLVAFFGRKIEAGYDLDIHTWSQSDDHTALRELLRDRQQGLVGAVLVGDLPAAWFAHNGEEFPIDLYYMDLDGLWDDADGDGAFDDHRGSVEPEIFTGRLRGTLSELQGYLRKVVFLGQTCTTLPFRSMIFVDDDWTFWHAGGRYTYGLEDVFGDANIDIIHDSMETISPAYRDSLRDGYQFMQIMAHSAPDYSAFSMTPSQCTVYAHTYLSVPEATTVTLSLKNSDPMLLFLNGQPAGLVDASTGNQFRTFPLTLQAGTNRFLVKVAQDQYFSYYNENFFMQMRIDDGNGHPVPGLQHQANMPQQGQAVGGYIRSWLVSGPYENSAQSWWNLLQYDFIGGETEEDPTQGGQWTAYDSAIPSLNFRDVFNSIPNESVAYASSRIVSPVSGGAYLSLGYKNNGIRVWWNGELVANQNNYDYEGTGYQIDRLLVPVTLKAGSNRLLIKVRNWWSNEFGCAARILDENMASIEGLSYDPAMTTEYTSDPLVEWLVLGVFPETDPDSRLYTDFLGGETNVTPSAGDVTAGQTWTRHNSLQLTVDLKQQSLYGLDGGVFTCQMVVEDNPRVYFYNQFNCSGARFTEDICLGNSYIFDNQYGLVSVGSTKTGSMLNFETFYASMGAGNSIGVAFQDWFIMHGESDWDWFYGMVILGDPTLRPSDPTDAAARKPTASPRVSPQLDPLIKADLWRKMLEERDRQRRDRPSMSWSDYQSRRAAH